jgi:hypothetical protein
MKEISRMLKAAAWRIIEHYKNLLDDKPEITFEATPCVSQGDYYAIKVVITYKEHTTKVTFEMRHSMCLVHMRNNLVSMLDRDIIPQYVFEKRQVMNNSEVVLSPNYIDLARWNRYEKNPLLLQELCRDSVRENIQKNNCVRTYSSKHWILQLLFKRNVPIPLQKCIELLPLPKHLKKFLNYWDEEEINKKNSLYFGFENWHIFK